MVRMRRVACLLLTLVMVIGMLPMYALRADAAGTLLDAAIFCSDVHGNPSTVTSVFNGIKNADSTFSPSTASFVGDTQTTASSVTSAAQEVYSSVQCIYAFGNHDDEGNYGIEDFTGLSYGSSSTNYYIYTISENDMSTSSPDTSGFTSTVAGLDKTKPLFIISHMPLHARRNDNNGAAAWYEAISAAAKSMDIFFFWAHNHTSESDVDTAAYYVAKNGSETISIQGGNTVTPNFTYANAGYVAPPNGGARTGVATAVRIYDDSVNLTVYNDKGVLTGTYAVNETVTRQFASSGNTDTTDPTDPTEDVTDPTEGETTDPSTPSEGETTTETKEVYVLVDTLTNNGEYLIVNTNAAGDGYAMNHSSGTEGAVAVSIQESGDYIYIDLDDSTAVWTATTKSSGFELMNGSYYLEAYGSTSAIEISTTQAYSARYWAYDSSALGYYGGNSTHYIYYDSGFVSAKNSGSEAVYIYEKQTITVSSDGTVSGGGSTEGGTTTGGSTETVFGDGTYTTADDGSYQKVTFGSTTTEKKTVYVLTSSISSGTAYLIANSNSAGSAYVVANNSGSVAATGVNVVEDDTIGTYIELTDATDELWTASGSSSTSLKNGSYYLTYSGSKGNYSLDLSTSSSSWTYSSNRLSIVPNKTTYYLVYDSGWDMSSSSDNVYFYVPTEVEMTTDTSVTYSVTASDIEHFYTADETDTETATITKSVTSGTPDGTYAYAIMGGDDIITSISDDGVITFNGSEGTAQVKVSYTWLAETDVNEDGTVDANDTYTIWQVIDVTATSPYYTIDLYKANVSYVQATAYAEGTTYFVLNEDGTYSKAEGVTADNFAAGTYYTLSYTLGDEITAPIAIKGIEEGDRYGVWAVVKYYDGTTADGTDMGAVGDAIEWSSSDETIATVDKNTGIITFTGKEGTVQITATYLNGNKPSDTITISVTQSQYSVPADGTNDFPEYPNEGAIRYDKTATAVGNFSETGIAQVELSMTGVPYTSGSEIDVVIMLDMTGSMTTDSISAARASAIAFADQIIKNKDGSYNNNRISVQQFNKDGVTELWALSAVTAETYTKLTSAINGSTQASGGTPYSTALQECYEILYAAKSDGTGNNRKQFCVFVSDGTPTSVTYITNTTTPTTTTTVSFTRNNATYTQTVPAYSTGSTSSTFESSDNSYHEYWSQLMINNSVAVYGVYTSVAAGTSDSNGGDSVNDTEVGTICMNKVATDSSKVYVVPDAEDTSALTGVFTNIANEILQAATDITVEDQITDEYTMIFDIPTDTNYNHTISTNQEFYIEFLKYTLDENHERVDSDSDGDTYDDATSVTKLYLGVSNGTYYAASDASGTAYAAPVFAQSVIGEKGTLYYWTIDEAYASKATVTYTNSDDTYYFIPYGMEANEDGTAPDGWYNMTSGAYAYGTVDSVTNTSTDLVIATPYFVYNASTKMLYWTVDKLDTAEYALRYFLYLDNSATDVGETTEVDAATYPTNDHAYITYTNFRGNDCQQKFPIPQLTWNGAQVSYVFYLVNSAGQPINKSGQVVDFANAVFVTDVYTKAVVWNKGVDGSTGTGELSADWLADELLPDEYTIYDELAGFTLNVYEKADGTTIKNQFTIEGDTAANISISLNDRLNLETTESTVSVVTTKVYNTKAGQKVTGYKTYYSTDTDMAGIDFSNVTVAFAVVWESKLVEDVVVVDYGLDVLINVVQNDLLQNTVSGIGVGNSAYGNIAMNTGVISTSQLGTAALTIDGNTISIENENAIRFHQGDMEFTAPVKFYYESPVKFYEDSEQKTGFMYSSVTVIPATTIYYEDEYVTLNTYTAVTVENEDGTTTTTYTKNSGWDTNSVEATATQDQDRPGESQISADIDADNNYGYDSAYTEQSIYSMGNAAKVNVKSGKYATAEFEFCGTGFDIISMTDKTTGVIVVDVYDEDGDKVLSETVNNYYGYARKYVKITYTYDADTDKWNAVEEDVDALGNSETKPENPADGATYTVYETRWYTVDNNDPNAIYQVPVLKIGDGETTDVLEYGKYKAVITATYVEILDKTAAAGYDFYLDAIRIYNPTGNKNEIANDAYVADGEGWPEYFEVRDQLITKDTFTTIEDSEGNKVVNGMVFIDGALTTGAGDAASVQDYISYGPNNEVYLECGNAIAFDLNATAKAGSVAKIQLAIKTVGGNGKVEVYGLDDSNNKTVGVSETIKTATDMYYDITDLNGKTVVIKNTGTDEAIISITNVKITYTEAQPSDNTAPASEGQDTEVYSPFTVSRATASIALMSMAPEAEEDIPEDTKPSEPTEPETTEPETEPSEPETTEPETEPSEPETTEPETEPTEPETTEPTYPDYGGTVSRFIKVIKKLLGWLWG